MEKNAEYTYIKALLDELVKLQKEIEKLEKYRDNKFKTIRSIQDMIDVVLEQEKRGKKMTKSCQSLYKALSNVRLFLCDLY